MRTMQDALATAARKERGTNRHIGQGKANPSDGYGGDEMIQRREAARRGSAMLLDRINAYFERRAAC